MDLNLPAPRGMRIRASTERDQAALAALHRRAFGAAEGAAVAELALALLDDASARPLLSLVAELDGEIAGHALFSAAGIGAGEAGAARILAPLAVAPEQLQRLRRLFDCHRLDDAETLAEIAARHKASGELLDPHSAIGTAAAAAALRDDVSVVVALACAPPAKFPDAVKKAAGVHPDLPPRLADLYEREERCTVLPNDLSALQRFIGGNRPPADADTRGAA